MLCNKGSKIVIKGYLRIYDHHLLKTILILSVENIILLFNDFFVNVFFLIT